MMMSSKGHHPADILEGSYEDGGTQTEKNSIKNLMHNTLDVKHSNAGIKMMIEEGKQEMTDGDQPDGIETFAPPFLVMSKEQLA